VPVDGQEWDTDPWTVTEKDGKYFGRGTCDMKGFDALSSWALVEAHHRGVARPLQLALSYDEEVGCLGAPPMIDRMLEILPKAGAVIVGEPSMMNAVTAHKGGLGIETHVNGFEVHSSLMHQGVSAIMSGARLIEWANQTNGESAAAEPSPIAAMFEPSYTTLHIGTIEGGTANNITAKDCRFSVDMRVLPDEDPDRWRELFMEQVARVEADMKAIRPDTSIDVATGFWVPGLRPEEDGEAERIVRQITGDNGEHVVSYGTEAGQFQSRGYSAVICGPGSIAQAHQPNEFIEIAQFDAGAAFLEKMIGTMGTA
jgi:acetylornithine deacetylase